MKHLFLSSLILIFSCQFVGAEVYFNDPIPQGAGVYGASNQTQSYNYNSGSSISSTYYSPSGTNYTRQGNQIYGSDGSSYTQFGSTVQNNSTGESYQINNNLIVPLY